jgi:integrase
VDCSDLTFASIDLDKGVHAFRRPKTMIPRRAILWPETITSIREYLKVRAEPQPGCEERVFLRTGGGLWLRKADAERRSVNSIGVQFAAYLRRVGLHQYGLGFATFRHVFATVGRGVNRHDALEYAMGHIPHGMTAEHYIAMVPDADLRAVVDHVRAWVFDGAG